MPKPDTFTGSIVTILLPNLKLTADQEKQLVANLRSVMRGEAVAASKDSVCISVGVPPVSIGYCIDIPK